MTKRSIAAWSTCLLACHLASFKVFPPVIPFVVEYVVGWIAFYVVGIERKRAIEKAKYTHTEWVESIDEKTGLPTRELVETRVFFKSADGKEIPVRYVGPVQS